MRSRRQLAFHADTPQKSSVDDGINSICSASRRLSTVTSYKTMSTNNNTNILVDHTLLDDVSIDYHYEPLDKERQIRLVQIQPSAANGDPIQLIVRHVDFEPDGCSDFTALSYVWGDPLPTYRVHIKGQNGSGWLSIRQGLFDFLCTQRSMDEPSLSF